jgi:ribosome-associated translation inhibitor RaiA
VDIRTWFLQIDRRKQRTDPMQRPVTVTFLGIPHSDWLEADIRNRAAKLDAYCRDIISCHVVVDLPHRHHEKGNHFSLRITVTARGEEIAVKRDGLRKQLRIVLRDAFDVVRRRLQDDEDRRRPSAGSSLCASRTVLMPDANSRPT